MSDGSAYGVVTATAALELLDAGLITPETALRAVGLPCGAPVEALSLHRAMDSLEGEEKKAMGDVKDKFAKLLDYSRMWLDDGKPDSVAGPSHWEHVDRITRAALMEDSAGYSESEALEKVRDYTDPDVKSALRLAFGRYKREIWAETGRILKEKAERMIGDLQREADECRELAEQLKSLS